MKIDPFFYAVNKEDKVLDFTVYVHYDFSCPHSAFDNLVLKTSKTNIKNKVKASFKLPHIVLIILIHIALFTVINLSSLRLEKPIPSPKQPILKASLYFRKSIRVNTPVELPIIEKPIITQIKPSKPSKITKSHIAETKSPIKKIHKEAPNAINEKNVTNIEDLKTKAVFNGKSLSAQSLSNLRTSINKKAAKRSSNEIYTKYLDDKNSVNKSINKFYPDTTKIAEIKGKRKIVDCTSVVQINIARLSGLMGGTIKCYSTPPLKDFLKSRNKH